MALTPRQQRFVDEYLVDFHATKAAIRAEYSPRTAQEQSSRLLSNVMVQEAIQSGMEAAKARTEIDADWVTAKLRKEAEFEGEGSSHSARVKATELLGKRIAYFPGEKMAVDLSGKVENEHSGTVAVTVTSRWASLEESFLDAATREETGALPGDGDGKPVDT